MQETDIKSSLELLEKLTRKAEICRFSHSEMKEECSRRQNYKELFIVLLSIALAILGGLYYRKVVTGEWVLLLLFGLPFIIMITQALDCNIFQWTHKLAKHEAAVATWGGWIRETDFLKNHLHEYSNDVSSKEMQHIQEKYNYCMTSTEQIPNRKFLKYKKKFREHVLKSKEIDKMTLEDIKRGR